MSIVLFMLLLFAGAYILERLYVWVLLDVLLGPDVTKWLASLYGKRDFKQQHHPMALYNAVMVTTLWGACRFYDADLAYWPIVLGVHGVLVVFVGLLDVFMEGRLHAEAMVKFHNRNGGGRINTQPHSVWEAIRNLMH